MVYKMNGKIKEKIKVFFIGTLAVLLLLELSLFIIGYIHHKKALYDKRIIQSSKYTHTILCLGDSFTYGLGALREENMPSQLQRLLDKKFDEGHIEVINRGIGGYNTTRVLGDLNGNIETIQPEIILLLVGNANHWNFQGYNTYLEKKGFIPMIQNYIERIRLYKLCKLLFYNIRRKLNNTMSVRDNIPSSYSNNKIGQDNKYYTIGINYEREGKYEEAIKSYQKGIEVNPGYGATYGRLGWLYHKKFMDDEAIEWYEKGIIADPDYVFNYCGIGWVYKDQHAFDEAIEWFKKALEVDNKYYLAYGGIGWSYEQQRKYEEAMEWFKKGILAAPDNTYNYQGLTQVYRSHRQYDQALAFFRPLASKYSIARQFVKIIERRENFQDEILKWVKFDIEKIITTCKKNNIQIILQNYPVSEPIDLTDTINDIAKKYSVSLVDHYGRFNELWMMGEKEEDYFVSDGHCNAKGYSVMARDVYDTLMALNIFESVSN